MRSTNIRALTIAYSVFLSAGGGLLIWLGHERDPGLLKSILPPLGGAIIGSSLSILFGHLTGSDMLNRTQHVLKECLSAGISSVEDKNFPKYRIRFHRYHVTEFEKGKRVWRYTDVDFSKDEVPGKLKASVCFIKQGPKRKLQFYKTEAGIIGKRLLMLLDPQDEEPALADVYPFLPAEYGTPSFVIGVSILEAYSKNQLVSPCILSKEPLEGWKKRGTVTDKTVSESLTKIWVKNFEEKQSIVPIFYSADPHETIGTEE